MKWNSLKDIINHFNLEVDETNVSDIRSALVQLLANSHPDKSGGGFSTEEQKERYNNIQSAIENLNILSSQQNALVSVNQITEIIRAVTDAIAPKKEDQKSNIEFKIKNELKREIKSNYNPIKIGSGTIVGVCTGLITFSKTLSENPILATLLKVPYINSILLSILFISATWFVFTWFREKRDEQRKEWLFSEDGKIKILTIVVDSLGREEDIEGKFIFNFRDFVGAIQGKRERWFRCFLHAYMSTTRRILYGSSKISISIAEQIARYHLSDLENRNIIKKYDRKSIELCYEIDTDLIRQLLDRY